MFKIFTIASSPRLYSRSWDRQGNNERALCPTLRIQLTSDIIGTVRYGHADRINSSLGTEGNNVDPPQINPIKNYNILQLDLNWRF